jgi:hypothetical protein
MSKSIHTTVASARRNNSRSELSEPDNADVASLAKKIGYKKAERRKRQSAVGLPEGLGPSEPGLPKA